jgi:hypothetical protein
MSHLAAMPSIIDKGRRHRYGNEILLNANSLMPDSQPHNKQFNARLRMHVALIQEMPAWYSALTKSNIAIVNDYLNLKLITWGMEMAGLGSLGVAGMSGDAVKGGVAAARGATGVRQGLASGARGAMAGVRGTITGGMAGSMAVAWAVGSIAYVALTGRMTELGHEITRRYQEKRLSADLYQKAFGDDIPMPERFLGQVR